MYSNNLFLAYVPKLGITLQHYIKYLTEISKCIKEKTNVVSFVLIY